MRWPGGPATFRPRLLAGIVVIWTLLAFLPVVQNDFVNWDDFAAGGLGQAAEEHLRGGASRTAALGPRVTGPERGAETVGRGDGVRHGAHARAAPVAPWGLVAVWTLVVFLPTIGNGFVNWGTIPGCSWRIPTHRGSWSDAPPGRLEPRTSSASSCR